MRLLPLIVGLLFVSIPALGQESAPPDTPADLTSAATDDGTAGDLPDQPAPVCGTRPMTIARMSWPSASLLAEIHSRLLTAFFQCNVSIVDGDLAATGSSMTLNGEPAVAPELWIARVPDIWNAAVTGQAVRQAGPSYDSDSFEGWFTPDFVKETWPDIATAEGLQAHAAQFRPGGKARFISCPPDWACAVVNRNLLKALGLEALFDIVEPANRFDMDKLIAEAVSRKEPVLFYYWRPNAVLKQFSFVPVVLPAYDGEAFKCLARVVCPEPKPSGFAPDPVVIALAEHVYTDSPVVAAYFARARMPMDAMDALLLAMQAPGATVETVADQFVSTQQAVWSGWVGKSVPPAQ